MRTVTDTGPLNYLVRIDQVSVLPKLFETIFVPSSVYSELSRSKAPQAVRNWIAVPPAWLIVRLDKLGRDARLEALTRVSARRSCLRRSSMQS